MELLYWKYELLMTKPTKMTVRPAKTQISLGIRPVWAESSTSAQWVAKDTSFLNADSKDSDQTGRMPRLIWVFAGRTVILLVLSRGAQLSRLGGIQKKSEDPTKQGDWTEQGGR